MARRRPRRPSRRAARRVHAEAAGLRRALGLVFAAVATVAGIDILGDATQTRPETVDPNSRTALVLRVSSRDTSRPSSLVAESLWSACQWTVRRRLEPPGIVQVGEHRFRLVLHPAIGPKGRQRLTGCLEDATIDRLRGKVVSMEDLDPAELPGP